MEQGPSAVLQDGVNLRGVHQGVKVHGGGKNLQVGGRKLAQKKLATNTFKEDKQPKVMHNV